MDERQKSRVYKPPGIKYFWTSHAEGDTAQTPSGIGPSRAIENRMKIALAKEQVRDIIGAAKIPL
jgi:hypothetical protein